MREKKKSSAPKQGQGIGLTVFSKDDGPLTKKISLADDGTAKSDSSACKMSCGSAQRAVVNSVEELAGLIAKLHSDQAIALGTLRDDLPDEVKIVAKKDLNGAAGVIARTSENFIFAEGQPALALIDFDRKGMPDEVSERVGDLW